MPETRTFWENSNACTLGKPLVDTAEHFLLIDERNDFEIHSVNTLGSQLVYLLSNPACYLSDVTAKFPLYFQFGV
jgi:hypothetical protein